MDRTNKPKPSADDLSRDQLEDLMARALEGSSPRGIGKKLTEGMSPEHPYDITPAPEECDRLLTLEGINVGDKQDIDYVSDHTLFVLKPRHETKSFVLQNIGISKLVDDKGNIIGGSISVHPGDVVRFLE
ncbi:MAG: hypothetical protein KDD55_07215, partial [Bdellovibrionales bacterium]|nr:hypothetical protein [Bdellovibrionales bacterium]